MDLNNKTLLVLAPHPDDEVLGCGGLISKVKALGGTVYVIMFALGNVQQVGGTSSTDTRTAEAQKTMEYMRVDGYEIMYKDDNIHLKLDLVPRKDLIDIVESASRYSLARTDPDLIAIPSLACQNQDHEAVYHAAVTACRPRVRENIRNAPAVLVYEQVDNLWSSRVFKPNVYVDISDHLDTKVQALSMYASQMRDEPNLRSIENIIRLARVRGSEICVRAAEAFECYRLAC